MSTISCSGFSLTNEEGLKLHTLRQYCPIPRNETKRLQILRECKLTAGFHENDVYGRYAKLIARTFKVTRTCSVLSFCLHV